MILTNAELRRPSDVLGIIITHTANIILDKTHDSRLVGERESPATLNWSRYFKQNFDKIIGDKHYYNLPQYHYRVESLVGNFVSVERGLGESEISPMLEKVSETFNKYLFITIQGDLEMDGQLSKSSYMTTARLCRDILKRYPTITKQKIYTFSDILASGFFDEDLALAKQTYGIDIKANDKIIKESVIRYL